MFECRYCQYELDTIGGDNDAQCPKCGARVVDTADDSTIHLSEDEATAGETTEHRDVGVEYRIGHYKLLRALGQGTYGAVWLAQDETLERVVAVKIPRSSAVTPDRIDAFIQEARAVARLSHPGIVRLFEVGKTSRGVFIVSEFIEGSDFREHLSNAAPSIPEAVGFARQLADALDHAHRQGIIHRDLKPANVMIDLQGQLHVMDFGLAKRLSEDDSRTVDGMIMGTPAYMSPEQARGDSRSVDPRSDVYSLGVILFELLTGGLPFRGRSRMLLHQVIHDDPPSLRSLNASIPADLENLCLKCLQKDPERRYASAAEFQSDLLAFEEGRPVSAKSVSRIERIRKWCRRNRTVTAFLLLTTLLMTIIIGLMMAIIGSLANDRDRDRRKANLLQEFVQKEKEFLQKEKELAEAEVNLLRAEVESNASRVFKETLFTATEKSQQQDHAIEMRRVGERMREGRLGDAKKMLAGSLKGDLVKDTRDWVWRHYTDRLNRQATFLEIAEVSVGIERIAWDGTVDRCLVLGRNGALRTWTFGMDPSKISTLKGSVSDFDVCPLDGRLVVVDVGGEVTLCESDGTNPRPLTNESHKTITTVRFQPDSAQLVLCIDDGRIRGANISTGQITAECRELFPNLREIAWHPTENVLAILTSDGKVAFWTVGTDDAVLRAEAAGGLTSISWSPDGRALIASGNVGVQGIDPKTGQVSMIDQTLRRGRHIACLPERGVMAIVTDYFPLRIWLAGNDSAARNYYCHDRTPTCLAASADGRFVVTGDDTGTFVVISQHEPNVPLPRRLQHGGIVRRFAFDHQGKRVASAGWDGRVVIWDRESLKPIGDFRVCGEGQYTEQVVWSPDDQVLAVSSNDGTISFWNASTFTELGRARGHQGAVWGIAWHPTRAVLMSGGPDRTVRMWDTENYQELKSWKTDGPVEQVTWNTNGSRIAVGAEKLRVFDPFKDSRHWPVEPTTDGFRNVQFHPTQPWVAAAAATGNVIVWNHSGRRREAELRANSTDVRGLHWSADGNSLVTASWDGKLRVWHVLSGELMLTLDNPEVDPRRSRYWWVEFSPDGTQIWASDHSGSIQVWTAGPKVASQKSE